MNKMNTTILSGAAAVGILAAMGGVRVEAEERANDAHLDLDAPSLWENNCASCHGRDGKANTRIGRRAGAKDLTNPDEQEAFSDQRAFKSIKEGMYENDKELMKPFGEGLSDENGLSDEEIRALVEYVRSFYSGKWTEELNQAALEGDADAEGLEQYINQHGPEAWAK